MTQATAATQMPCRVCSRTPTRVLTIRRHVGMLLIQRFVKFKGPLCRDHGVELTKKFLGMTLWQGWWGYISFFVNFFVIGTDLMALSQAKAIPAPQGAPAAATPTAAAAFDPDSAPRIE